MFSINKHEDKQLLNEIGQMILALRKQIHREGVINLIEKFGEDYETLEKRIKTHDYSKEDEALNRADKRIKDYENNLCNQR